MTLELIGYAASLLIAISLMMKSLIRLRVLNGIGALVFVAYGILIKAYPVAVLNGLIVIIDIYYLVQMIQRKDYFSLMEVSPNSTYLQFFLRFHLIDIRNFFPQVSAGDLKIEDVCYFILRDTIPAGLVVLRISGNEGQVILDYALKDYRDFKIGSFLFDDNADELIERGITILTAESDVPIHTHYLHQMDFTQDQDGTFHKKLTPHILKDQKF